MISFALLEQGIGYRVKGTNTTFYMAHEKYQQIVESTALMAKLFAITDPKGRNRIGQDLCQGATLSVLYAVSAQ